MQPAWMREILNLTKDSEIDDIFPCLYYNLQQEIQPDEEKWEAYRAYKNFIFFKDLQYRQVVDETDIEVLKNWLRQRLILKFKIYQGQEVPKHLEENIYGTLKIAYRQSKGESQKKPLSDSYEKKEKEIQESQNDVVSAPQGELIQTGKNPDRTQEKNEKISEDLEQSISSKPNNLRNLHTKVFSRIKKLISQVGGSEKTPPKNHLKNQHPTHHKSKLETISKTLHESQPKTQPSDTHSDEQRSHHTPKITFHIDQVMDLDTIFMNFIKEVMVENNLILKPTQSGLEEVYLAEFGLQRPTEIYQDIYLLHHISNWRNEALGNTRLVWDNICYLAYLNNTLGNYVIVPEKKAYLKDLGYWDVNFLETKHIGAQNQNQGKFVKPDHLSLEQWEKGTNTIITNTIFRNYHLLISLNPELKENKDIKKYYDEEMARRKKLEYTDSLNMPSLFD